EINGFGNGDAIDLTNLAFTTSGEFVSYDQGYLTVFDNGAIETFKLNGNYTSEDFALVDDGHGGTEVVFADRWINPNGGNWSDSANWSAGVPGPHDTAVIEAAGLIDSGHLVVDLDDHEEVANLFVGDYRTELDIDTGGSLKVLNMLEDSGAIIVGPVDDSGFDPSLKVYGE